MTTDKAMVTVEFVPAGEHGNAIIAPTDDYAGAYFTLIGSGPDDGQNALGERLTSAINAAALAQAEQPVWWPWRTKYQIHQRVRKTKGSSWQGRIVGFYASSLTTVGYAVESEREPGSVQIYPEAALELVPDDDALALAHPPAKREAGETPPPQSREDVSDAPSAALEAPLNSFEVEVLEMLAGKRDGQWGAWVGAVLGTLSGRGLCSRGPNYQITDSGRAALEASHE